MDGLHLGDFFAQPLDFNPATGMTPDCASWAGALQCIAEIESACRAVNPDFCVSVDVAWDYLVSVAPTSGEDCPRQSPMRIAFPRWRPAATIAEGYDFGVVNDALSLGGRLRIAPAIAAPLAQAGMDDLLSYLAVSLRARMVLRDTLVDGRSEAAGGLVVEGSPVQSVFRSAASELRTAVLVNSRVQGMDLTASGFADNVRRPVILWTPGVGARAIDFPTTFTLPAEQVAMVTEEPVLEQLRQVPVWTPRQDLLRQRIVFAFQSASDLEGWTLNGDGLSVCALPGLCRRPTFNSYGLRGESATGTALSPPFHVEADEATLEILFHGGISRETNGRQNLAIRLVDAQSGEVLREILPPGTHVLTTRSVAVEDLLGKPLRLEIVDQNSGGSFAWIGLQRAVLVPKN